MSGSVALLQPLFALISMSSVSTEGCEGSQCLGCHIWPVGAQGPCYFRGHLVLDGLPPGAMEISGPRILPETMSVSLPLLQLGLLLMSVAPVAIESHVATQEMGCQLGPCWYLRVTLQGGDDDLSSLHCHLRPE